MYYVGCILTNSDFGTSTVIAGKTTWKIQGSLLGIISASYNLGAILAVPVVPYVAQRFGRRWSIFIGSGFQCAGALIQGFSQHGNSNPICYRCKSLISPKLACILWHA
jgi:MFS family permease